MKRKAVLLEPIGISLCKHISAVAVPDGCLIPLYTLVFPVSLIEDPEVRLSLIAAPYSLNYVYDRLFNSILGISNLRAGYKKMVRHTGTEGDTFVSNEERRIVFYCIKKKGQGFFFAEYNSSTSNTDSTTIHYGCIQSLDAILAPLGDP